MAKRLIPTGEPKECTGCGESFPNTPEYFSRKHKGDDVHLIPKCKTCAREVHRNWRKKNPEKSRERAHRHHDNNLEKVRGQTLKRVMKHYSKDIEKSREAKRKQARARRAAKIKDSQAIE